ncbi:MAG: aminotransferase class I/II-fold pyridoxal phosphate-dependent enzyme [Planctomycetota bacterium]
MTRQDLVRRLETACPRVGQGEADGDPLVTPIVQSTTFCRDGIDSAPTHKYSRESNPTVAALEQALGELEEAPPAVCYGTGLAAEAGLLLALLQHGDHLICSQALYGGTTRLLQQVLVNAGISTSFVDTTDVAAVEAAVRQETRLIFAETPANPTLALTDLRALADLATRHGLYLAVDNTFMTPVLQQPLELGAHFSVYSTTKFIEGHSAALGGAVVSHDEAALERCRFVRKCIGNIQAPFNAWLTLQGLKTLPLRMTRQTETAAQVARWLDAHSETTVVHYPGLANFAQAELAQRQHPLGHGAVVSFELRGGAAGARALLRHVRLCRLAEHVGSVETLLTHSASMTHGGVAAAERERSGVTDALLRLSVGLEHPETIIDDLQQALIAAADAATQSPPTKTGTSTEVEPCGAHRSSS